MAFIPLAVGVPILFFGRKIYWFLVGALGFMIGLASVEYILPQASGWTPILFACGVGLVGAVLAMLLQKFALAIAGFFGGGYLGIIMLSFLSLEGNTTSIIAFALGAIVGATLVFTVFDYAIIILSTVTGSVLVTQGLMEFFNIQSMMKLAVFGVLLVFGIIVQLDEKSKE